MSRHVKVPILDLPTLALWLVTFIGAIVATHLLRNAQFPIGWNYLALFLLAGVSSTLGQGIYRWMAAAWGGALLMWVLGTLRQNGYLLTPPGLLAAQYLPAALTGALLGEWLRYRLSRWRGVRFSPLPSLHALLVVAVLLMLLPLVAFLYAADLVLAGRDPLALLMFSPGNTPFLFPSLITAALCGYWVRSAANATRNERHVALLVILLSLLLMVLALTAKLLFGYLQVA
ncbi:MAG TPA: hypothetical protein VGE00_04195 [Gammaproteobacteria bacterium]